MIKIINIFSTKNINIVTVIISVIIIFSINLFINNNSKGNLVESKNEKIVLENNENEKKDESKLEQEKFNWYIEIPLINLKAPIKEGTDMNILNTYVGHFEETKKAEGNIGLAGHNRGYEKNYFENLNKLQKGNEIKYKYNEFEKIYIIDVIEVIKNTNWEYLENTKENKITLITCIENKPDYRLCVQATEK